MCIDLKTNDLHWILISTNQYYLISKRRRKSTVFMIRNRDNHINPDWLTWIYLLKVIAPLFNTNTSIEVQLTLQDTIFLCKKTVSV